MITSILPYIGTYGDVRAITGLNEMELPDTDLALITYQHELGLTLDSTSGVYFPSAVEQTLQEMFDSLPTTDPMYATIQMLSVYTVANRVMDSVGLKAWKSQADGKSSIGRFAPESTYLGTRASISKYLKFCTDKINDLLEITADDQPLLTAIKPDVDVVTGT